MPDYPYPDPVVQIADGQELARDLVVIPNRRVQLVPNIGVIAGTHSVLVVETGMGPRNAESVLAFATDYARGRRLYLTTTHFHPEHAFGAQVFAGQATFLINQAQADDLAAKGPGYLDNFRGLGEPVARQLEGVRLVTPDLVYDDAYELDLGGRVVRMRATGQAHTKGDQVITVPDAGVMFTGDLDKRADQRVGVGLVPGDDQAAGGHVSERDGGESPGPGVAQRRQRRQPDRAVPQDGLHALADRADHGPVAQRAAGISAGDSAAPVGAPCRIGSLGELEPAAVIKVAYQERVVTGERVVGAQDHPDRIRAQHPGADPGAVERHPGQGDIDQAGSQPGGRVGEVRFPYPHLHALVTLAKGVGETGADLPGAVGESPDGEGGRSRGRGDPGPGALSLLEQGPRLLVERGSRGRERASGRRAVQQECADIGFELPDGPAQRRLGHVQAGGGAPEVALLGDGDEVSKRAQVHYQRRYP